MQQNLLKYMYKKIGSGITEEEVLCFYKNKRSAMRCISFLKDNHFITVSKNKKDRRKSVYFLSIKGIAFCYISGGDD